MYGYDINSTAEFHVIVGAAVTRAIADVIDMAYEELKRIIETNIYSSSGAIASHTIPDAWRCEAYALAGELTFQPSMLAHNPDEWVHGSAYDQENWEDTREIILDIIQGGYRAYNAKTGVSIGARPFWDEFLASVDAHLDGWVHSALSAQGLVAV